MVTNTMFHFQGMKMRMLKLKMRAQHLQKKASEVERPMEPKPIVVVCI